jgi:hypothetical protein
VVAPAPVVERLVVDEPVVPDPVVAEPEPVFEGVDAPVPAAPEPDVPEPEVPEPLVCACGTAHHMAAITALTAKIFDRFFIGISVLQVLVKSLKADDSSR